MLVSAHACDVFSCVCVCVCCRVCVLFVFLLSCVLQLHVLCVIVTVLLRMFQCVCIVCSFHVCVALLCACLCCVIVMYVLLCLRFCVPGWYTVCVLSGRPGETKFCSLGRNTMSAPCEDLTHV